MRGVSAVVALLGCILLAVRMAGMILAVRFAAFGMSMAGQPRIVVMPDGHALRRHHARQPLQRQGNGQQGNRNSAENFLHPSLFYVSSFERQRQMQFSAAVRPGR